MSGLLFLTKEDFSLKRGVKGNELVHSIPGFSFILFSSLSVLSKFYSSF